MGRPKSSQHLKPEQSSSKQKKQSKKPSSKPISTDPDQIISNFDLLLQQKLLTCFTTAFPSRFDDALQADVQKVKGHLYERDFEKAFGDEEGLEAYTVRWSAGRALAYLHLFTSIPCVRACLLQRNENGDGGNERRKVLCLGGGAGAEVVALAGWLHELNDRPRAQGKDGGEENESARMEVLALDVASWSSVLQKLNNSLINPPPLSPYAGAAVKAANRPLVSPDDFSVEFQQRDVLEMENEALKGMCRDVGLVTLMFTLNELYTTSISRTTKKLLDLTSVTATGAVLLVVDSPGNYSIVGLNKAGGDDKDEEGRRREKKYPMQWLLDHTLLEAASQENGDGEGEQRWEKVHEEESRWLRLGAALKHPIALEDMRMQVHVYRRL